MRAGFVVATLLSTPLLIGSPEAQQVLQPSLQFPEPFSSVMGVRELSSGELFVADRIEKSLYRVDLETGSYDMVGRNGQGPLEYDSPSRLLALPADSTLMVDFGNRRYAVLDPSGGIVTTSPIMQDMSLMINPDATDREGNIWWDGAGTVMTVNGRLTGGGEEAPIMRLDRASGDVDTMAMVGQVDPSVRTSSPGFSTGSATFTISRGASTPFSYRVDDWVLFPDGRLVIVRKDTYQLDMVMPDGSLRTGSPIEYAPIRIRNDDKEAWADVQASRRMNVVSIGGSGGGGSQSIQGERPDLDEVDFPDHFPAWMPGQTRAGPNGETWVRRYQSYSERRPLFDVFDSYGRLDRQVRPTRRATGSWFRCSFTLRSRDG